MSSLPRIPDIQQLSPNVTCILGQNPSPFTLQGTNTYLVGRPDTRERILIDTGSGHKEYYTLLKNYVESNKLHISAIAITHSHIDHVGGIADVLKLSPGAKIYKHVLSGAECSKLKRGHHFLETTSVTLTNLTDKQVISIAGLNLKAYYTPGHCVDHLSYWIEEEGALFSGDNLLGHGSSVFEEYRPYMQSLMRMRDLPLLKRVYPGHGEMIENGVNSFNSLIEHRYERISEMYYILASAGVPITDEELVAKVYKDFRERPKSVQDAAINNARQYLFELKREGRAQFTNGKWLASKI